MNKILSFDAESNGLHGEVFAIGAVVIDRNTGTVLETFQALTYTPNNLDAWVAENVMPALKDMRITHHRSYDMRAAFWQWLMQQKASCTIVVDCGWPVEARLLASCVVDDPTQRAGNGPYPLHEVATMLLCAGLDPLASYGETVLPGESHRKHHPVYDAHVSALCARMALQQLSKFRGEYFNEER